MTKIPSIDFPTLNMPGFGIPWIGTSIIEKTSGGSSEGGIFTLDSSLLDSNDYLL